MREMGLLIWLFGLILALAQHPLVIDAALKFLQHLWR